MDCLKFLENDEQILEKGENANPAFAALLKDIVKKVSTHLERTLDTEPEALISDHRYGYIHVCSSKT
jgi:ferrous iron transport protein B